MLTHLGLTSIPYVHFNTLVGTVFMSSPYSHAPSTIATAGLGGTVVNGILHFSTQFLSPPPQKNLCHNPFLQTCTLIFVYFTIVNLTSSKLPPNNNLNFFKLFYFL